MGLRTMLRWWKNNPLRTARSADRRRLSKCRLAVERMEDRTVPTTFFVTNLGDTGVGTLRQAILDANAAGGADVINFTRAPAGAILLKSNLPALSDPTGG